MKSQLTFKYSLVQGSYWGAFCSVIGYATPFLLSRDFSSSQIGVLIACGNILSVLLQPLIASMADRSKKIRLNTLSAIIASGALFSAVILSVIPNSFYMAAGLFTLIVTITSLLMPMVNSLSVKLTNRGYEVNYGVARGIGSLGYAGISYILGYLINLYGENIIIVAVLVLYLVLVITLLWFKSPREEGIIEEKILYNHKNNSENKSVLAFVKRYKSFMFMNLGIICLFTFHNIINNYLLQIMISVGGDSGDMGVSIAIAALLELPTMFLFSFMVKRLKSNELLKIASIFFAVKSIAFYLATSVIMIHMSQIFQALSFALYIPAAVHYTDTVMENRDKIKGQSIISASLTAGGVIGSLLGGYLIDSIGVTEMLLAGVLFSVGGMIIFLLSATKPSMNSNKGI